MYCALSHDNSHEQCYIDSEQSYNKEIDLKYEDVRIRNVDSLEVVMKYILKPIKIVLMLALLLTSLA